MRHAASQRGTSNEVHPTSNKGYCIHHIFTWGYWYSNIWNIYLHPSPKVMADVFQTKKWTWYSHGIYMIFGMWIHWALMSISCKFHENRTIRFYVTSTGITSNREIGKSSLRSGIVGTKIYCKFISQINQRLISSEIPIRSNHGSNTASAALD